MEDAVKVVLGFTRTAGEVIQSGCEYDFFGVYDGHGSAQVAHTCRDRMHMIMAEEMARRWTRKEEEFSGWDDIAEESFRKVDAEAEAEVMTNMKKLVPDGGKVDPEMAESVGSTALVVVVGQRRIVVANCGDSRAVLSRGGTAVMLSSDHKVIDRRTTQSESKFSNEERTFVQYSPD